MTLVEVVVASVILGMIMLATATALSSFGRTYDRLLTRTDDTAEMREVAQFLRLALRDALSDSGLFVGQPEALEWVTPLDRVGAAGGLQRLRIRMAGDGLLLSFAPYEWLADDDADVQWGAVVDDYILVDELESFSLSYYADPWSDPLRRVGQDVDLQALPFAVGIDISAGGRTWPPIIVRLEGYRLL